MDDRRFSTPEIEEVFARAAASQQREQDADLGLTAEELQAVGAEAGLDPAHVAAAARAVASGEPEEGRESLVGIPVGVHRAATLAAPVSDDLWEHVTADLRETFAARGKTEQIGESRIWRNGNLRATLSPSGDGSRLRIQTNRRKDTRGMLTGGAIQVALSLLFALGLLGSDGDAAVILGLIGAGLIVSAAVRQVTWVRTRERQMDDVNVRAQRTAKALASDTSARTTSAAPVLDLLHLGDDVGHLGEEQPPPGAHRGGRRARG